MLLHTAHLTRVLTSCVHCLSAVEEIGSEHSTACGGESKLLTVSVGCICRAGQTGYYKGLKTAPLLLPPPIHTHTLDPPPSCQVVSPHPMRLFDGWGQGGRWGYRFPRRPRHKQPGEIRTGTRDPTGPDGAPGWVLIPTYQRQINTPGRAATPARCPPPYGACGRSFFPLFFNEAAK